MVWQPSSCQFSRWGPWELLSKWQWKARLADPPDSQDFTTVPGMLAEPASLFPLLLTLRKGCQPVCSVWETSAALLRSPGYWEAPPSLWYPSNLITLQEGCLSPVCTLTGEKPLTCSSTLLSLLSHFLSKLPQPRLEWPPGFARARTILFRNKGVDNWDFDLSENVIVCFCWVMLSFLVSIFPHNHYFHPLCRGLIPLNSNTAVSPGNQGTETLLSSPHTHTHTYTHTHPLWNLQGEVIGFQLFLKTLSNFFPLF